MTFPTALTNAVDGVTEIIAAHLNNLEAKVGIDNSAVATSLDYLLRNPASVNPGHLHTASQVGLSNVTNDAQVILQATTPGAAQTGHANVSGTVTAAQLSVPPGTTTALAISFTGSYYTNTGFDVGGGSYKGLDFLASGNVYGRFADISGAIGTFFTSRYAIGFTGSISHTINAGPDLYLCRAAAASLRLGADHATTPTGQTIKAHNVTTGTGASLTLAGGTGSVAYGNVLLNPTSGNVGIKASSFGTSAVGVLALGSGTAPTTAPADMVQLWCADVNGAAGYAGLHKRTETTNLVEVVPGVVIKTDTGDSANPYEGLMQINTFDNTFKVYADAGWRQLATW
jgi:hypothetical protein